MSKDMLLGSADWNLWPISMDYDVTFPEFKKSGIDCIEIGIYVPSRVKFRKEKSYSRVSN